MPKAKFGTPLGVAPGGVVAFSSDYETADPSEFPTRRHYIGHHDGIYTGYRFQCVEFARRFLIQTQRITFGDVGMAYEIFELPHMETLGADELRIPIQRTLNGESGHLPVLGTLILWRPGGYFRHTGHVAVVTHVDQVRRKIGVAEQNVHDRVWRQGENFSRELDFVISPKGEILVEDKHWPNTKVLGWVTPEPLLAQSGAATERPGKASL